MKAIVFPKILDENTVAEHWANSIVNIVKGAKGKKATELTVEEKVAIALFSGMDTQVVDDHMIGSVRVGPKYAFEIVDGKDGKWSVVSCAPLRNR